MNTLSPSALAQGRPIERPVLSTQSPAMQRGLVALHRRLGASRVLSGEEACAAYQSDDSGEVGQLPAAVVLAESVADIRAALEIAQQFEIPVTPRAAATSRVGGAVPLCGGIVLSLLGLNQIKELDRQEQLVVVEPGVVLADLQAAVEAEGLFYPPDPNSQATCTLGGNVASNAGGPRAFKYGVTRNYVLGVEAHLMGGQTISAGRRTRKGVTGYDVAGLLVGSEGTLGLLSEITLRLIPQPESVMTLMALFSDVRYSGRCVEQLIAAGLTPRCLELFDAAAVSAMRKAGNAINERAGAMLLMEVDGAQAEVERAAARLGGICEDVGALELLVAQDAAQRDRLWGARRQMSFAVRQMARHKLSEDVVVPRQEVGALLRCVEQLSEQFDVRTVTYGHAGDGNLHVNFLWDEPDEKRRVDAAIVELFKAVIGLRGTLSGEHGIGLTKAPFLHLEQSTELIELQKNIKQVFDPKGLLNPGKIFSQPGRHGSC